MLPRTLFFKGKFPFAQLLAGQQNSKINVGDFISVKRTYNSHQVETFANISGDKNPIHLDEEVAKKSIFKKRVVHGIFSGSIFSQMVGTVLQESIYLGQTLKFTSPVFIDEEVEGKMVVSEVNQKKKIIKFQTTVTKINDNKVAVIGEAVVLYKHLEE